MPVPNFLGDRETGRRQGKAPTARVIHTEGWPYRVLECWRSRANQDTAAAVENLLVVANMLGYGACWVGAFSEDAVRDVLDVPDHLRPVALVPVGPCRPITRSPGRRPASSIFEVIE